MSVLANGKKAKQLRDERGWHVDDLIFQTHLAVEHLSKRELELGRPGRFTQRLRRKERTGELASLSKAAIYAVEAGKRVSLSTLQILAETYGVDVRDLTRSNELEADDVDSLPALLADLRALNARLQRFLDSMSRDQRDDPDADHANVEHGDERGEEQGDEHGEQHGEEHDEERGGAHGDERGDEHDHAA